MLQDGRQAWRRQNQHRQQRYSDAKHNKPQFTYSHSIVSWCSHVARFSRKIISSYFLHRKKTRMQTNRACFVHIWKMIAHIDERRMNCDYSRSIYTESNRFVLFLLSLYDIQLRSLRCNINCFMCFLKKKETNYFFVCVAAHS